MTITQFFTQLRRSPLKATALVLALCLLLASPAAAQLVRTWVSTTGLDTNPCTRAAPCRNFAAAVAAVDERGEVVVLDSGGYGPVTITRSVSLIAPASVHAAIAPTANWAILIDGDDNTEVIVRGLYLNSQGGLFGVNGFNLRTLHVESCVTNGFLRGVEFQPGLDGATLYVRDSVFRNNTQNGIRLSHGPFILRAMISRSHFQGNNMFGIAAGDAAQVVAVDVTSSGANGGFATHTFDTPAVVVLERAVASNSGVGAATIGGPGRVRLSNCTLTNNSIGMQFSIGGQVLSRGNNFIEGNGSDQTPSGTFPPQ